MAQEISPKDKGREHLVHKRIRYHGGEVDRRLLVEPGGTVPDFNHLPDADYVMMRRRGYFSPVSSEAVDATEEAIALAKQHDVDVTSLTGSGQGGRVLVADVEAAVAAEEADNA